MVGWGGLGRAGLGWAASAVPSERSVVGEGLGAVQWTRTPPPGLSERRSVSDSAEPVEHAAAAPGAAASAPPRIDVLLPVYNEEHVLPQSVSTLVAFLRERVDPPWRVLITDNASIDGTEAVSRRLADEYPEVDYVRLPQKGRGGALRRSLGLSTSET